MDQTLIRSAFSQFATGITIVTTLDEKKSPLGVTVNSFTSVSLEPPLVLWCFGEETFSLQSFLNAHYNAVNVLSDQQQAVSNNFAMQGDFNRFVDLPYSKGIHDVPLISDCIATFQCRNIDVQKCGDHWLMISEVESFFTGIGKPLIYYSSKYKQIS